MRTVYEILKATVHFHFARSGSVIFLTWADNWLFLHHPNCQPFTRKNFCVYSCRNLLILEVKLFCRDKNVNLCVRFAEWKCSLTHSWSRTKWKQSVSIRSAVTFTSRKELPGVTGNKLGGTENQLGAMKQRKILLLLLGIGPWFLGRLYITVATILTQPFELYYSLNFEINENFPFRFPSLISVRISKNSI